MNLVNKTDLSQQQTTYWEEQTFEKEFDSFNEQRQRCEKIKIQIKITSDQIIYSQNRAVFRVVEGLDVLEKPEIFNNMDQIRNLSWQGQYDQNKKKDGKWITFWNKAPLENVGGQSLIIIYILYYKEGQKLGLWSKILIFNIMNNKSNIFEIGEYYNGLKIGRWNYICQDRKIGGGSYNKVGWKQGKWIELDEGYYSDKKVIYFGDFNMKGMKVGRWDIMYDGKGNGEYKQIGGGSYDQEGILKKIGKWVELDEKFNYEKQVTYNGEYNMNNMKVGRWDIMYYGQQIGGGSYDQEGNQKKIGKWVELFEGFKDYAQVTYNGEYNMNNMKVGRWDILCRSLWKGFKQIGGGSYDQEGNQKKIGKWVELFEGFNHDAQVTHNGEYNMNSMKVGRWDIVYYDRDKEEYNQIGSGSYDQEGNQKKIGKWVELFEGFNHDAQVTHNGEYNMNSMKVGKWDIMYDRDRDGKYKQIIFKFTNIYSGGGSYDQEENQKKIGKWIELDENFYDNKQVTYNGEYNMNGQKVGIWVEMDIKSNNKKGEKIYD